MKTKFNKFPDEKIYEILHEYFTTEITQPELMKKYNFGGPNTIYRWMKKLGISKQDVQDASQVDSGGVEGSKSTLELELERRILSLERDLEREKLRTTALSTMIEIAERSLGVDIRKKPGAKQ